MIVSPNIVILISFYASCIIGQSLISCQGIRADMYDLAANLAYPTGVAAGQFDDGIRRSNILLIENQEVYFTNLGLSTPRAGLQKPPLILKITKAGGVTEIRAALFIDRCGKLNANPPSHWDPVFSHISK